MGTFGDFKPNFNMKYLTDYTDKAISEAFNKAGAFFAFGQKQFDEKKKDGVVYVNMGAGLICPKDNADQLDKDLEAATKAGIAADLEENGRIAVIKRELYNHEAFYTGEIEDTCEALKPYGITEAEIRIVYNQERKNYKD